LECKGIIAGPQEQCNLATPPATSPANSRPLQPTIQPGQGPAQQPGLTDKQLLSGNIDTDNKVVGQSSGSPGNNAIGQQGGASTRGNSAGVEKPLVQPSQPECVPGYHWDTSQQKCVAD
jgi:hypothetical protein